MHSYHNYSFLVSRKTEYIPGEIVRGTVAIKTEKSSKARQLMLLAEGKESTIITVSENTGSGSSRRHTTRRTYSEINTFFSKDLSQLLQKSQELKRVTIVEEYKKNIELENEGHDYSMIPFEYQIPDKVNQSYKGKYSEYFWGLEAKLNVAWASDITARTIIEVI